MERSPTIRVLNFALNYTVYLRRFRDDCAVAIFPSLFLLKTQFSTRIPSFGIQFSPVKFSAQGHSTSELLRTLLMSGCF